MRRDSVDAYAGCLLGGALGDAMGAAVEFMSWRTIAMHYGDAGVTTLESAYGRRGAITDDTQMTLFGAEALSDAYDWHGSASASLHKVHDAWRRWLHTQGYPWSPDLGEPKGLVTMPELHRVRAPGTTCTSALSSGVMGTVDKPINRSRGCGAVMRMAPVGLATWIDDPFDIGCKLGAITHGHPSAYLPAGMFALTVRRMVEGKSLRAALDEAIERVDREPGSAYVLAVLEHALCCVDEESPSRRAMASIGSGWVGHEAFAMAVFAALAKPNNIQWGLPLAVNHSGDSDSVGSIAGTLLGLQVGKAGLPADWLGHLELRDTIEHFAKRIALTANSRRLACEEL